MASLNNLSNEDLRKKLKEYGVTTPVTASTRNILLKKLNHLLASDKDATPSPKSKGNPKQKRGTSSPTRDDKNSSLRTGTRSRNSLSPKNKSKSGRNASTLNAYSSEEEETEEDEVPVTRSRRSLRNSRHEVSESNISTSYVDSINNSLSSPQSSILNRKPVPLVRKKSNYLSSLSYLRTSPKTKFNLHPEKDDQYDTGSDTDPNDETDKGRQNIFYREKMDPQKSLFGGEYLRRKGFNNSGYNFSTRISSGFSHDVPMSNDPREEVEITSPDDIVSQEPTALYSSQLSNGSPFDRVRKITSETHFWDSNFWLQAVPFLLLVLLALFFGFLGFCYLSIHTPVFPTSIISFFNLFNWRSSKLIETDNSDTLPISGMEIDTDAAAKFPICTEDVKLSCLSVEEAKNVPDILPLIQSLILPALQKRASEYQCRTASSPYLETEKIISVVKEKLQEKSTVDLNSGLHGVGKLASLHHPKLAIEPVWDSSYTEDGIPRLLGLASISRPTEILCHLVSALYSLTYFGLALLVVAFAVWLGYQVFCYYLKKNEELEQKSFELVEQILEVLENSCGTGGKDFIAVNHVRDCLIPPRERKEKMDIWNKAVNFIDNHDSRVYREIRSVGGDDCEVWRWVSGAPRSPIACPPKGPLSPEVGQTAEKMWQGQAFESLESTQNLPQVSPTSCLKIRNMFDCELEYGENWHWRIQDSLLEKCEGIKIVHVAVDRISKEGCVYLKCSSPQEAGLAFRSLHGWWFDGNLVTVKYLRDERYHERFPTARLATTPLTPSNNKRLSLQTESPLTVSPPSMGNQSKYSATRKRVVENRNITGTSSRR